MKIKLDIDDKIRKKLQELGFVKNKGVLELVVEKDIEGKPMSKIIVGKNYLEFPNHKKLEGAKIVLAIISMKEKDLSFIIDVIKTLEEKEDVVALKEKNKMLEKQVKMLEDRIERKSIECKKVKEERKKLEEELKKLKNIPEIALKQRILKYIEEHEGRFNITEFSKENKVGEVIVKEMLDKLIKQGYLKRID